MKIKTLFIISILLTAMVLLSSCGEQIEARNGCSTKVGIVFDIGGNKYRIITLVDYTRQTVLITHVMDHKAYDKCNWKNDI